MAKEGKLGRARIFVPSAGPPDWQKLLAEPEKQWRSGYSAKTLAHSWHASDGLPPEVAAFFPAPCELLLAIPEYRVPLAGGGRDSQNDVFLLLRYNDRTCAATIEGKVSEPFGPTLGEWLATPSKGKAIRLQAICDLLGLGNPLPLHIRYQLLHRAASAVIESQRFKTDEAAMIVHSFSPTKLWFDDFANFCGLFHKAVKPDEGAIVTCGSAQPLRLGWATGDPIFLTA
ncbi:hypothetical protein P6U16_11985 [Rhizobium sp. 32-5/1]|uniref:DUF6946 family protein n=1 Tax=Rhizobium sp. 32-5/1 TaxID=3019602 RepID=UPI00240D65E4|nr:hypothetical protein [Rhizobium sp. 32-5/1]WEZ81973.1 hypothetical protein P6U16_11985 [Rhizobium sp. 32-5/1]